MSKHNVARNGRVHIKKEMCATCIFRPGNLMHLDRGRVAGMVKKAKAGDSTIICHDTLDGDNAGCKGFFDRHATQPLQIAERLGLIEWVA